MPTIDLRSPEGNACALMGAVKGWCRQMGEDPEPVLADMRSGDYAHLLQVMRDWAQAHHLDLTLLAVYDEDEDENENGDED